MGFFGDFGQNRRKTLDKQIEYVIIIQVTVQSGGRDSWR